MGGACGCWQWHDDKEKAISHVVRRAYDDASHLFDLDGKEVPVNIWNPGSSEDDAPDEVVTRTFPNRWFTDERDFEAALRRIAVLVDEMRKAADPDTVCDAEEELCDIQRKMVESEGRDEILPGHLKNMGRRISHAFGVMSDRYRALA